jgi:low affinity Fe/Cu permease
MRFAPEEGVKDRFHRFALRVSAMVGTPTAFLLALGAILLWSLSGPLFHFSDTWQLVINTGTTIVTFLIVFLIQNTQNRDSKALHLKLDELILHLKGPRNQLLNVEDLSDAEIEKLHAEFERVAENSKGKRKKKSG